jgi:hypothetical protein
MREKVPRKDLMRRTTLLWELGPRQQTLTRSNHGNNIRKMVNRGAIVAVEEVQTTTTLAAVVEVVGMMVEAEGAVEAGLGVVPTVA